ncbi:MAG: amidohydrolase [Bacteroidia bacterium]|nr:amidohydrolase [Bacteroidia bacterium]
MNRIILLIWISVGLMACETRSGADLIVHNARIYTVDSALSVAEAFVVKDGKFLAVGKSGEILKNYTAKEVMDLQGKPVFPGFMDAHCHFYWYGKSLNDVNLTGTASFSEVLSTLVDFRKKNPQFAWLTGRGWDQNDWEVKEFPEKDSLDILFPDVPVCIRRVDGHALIANEKALSLAGITPETTVEGGKIMVKNGKLTGVLIDNAMDLLEKVIPAPSEKEMEEYLLEAQQNCFEKGLTSVGDAGLDKKIIHTINQMHKTGKLLMRIYAMVSADSVNIPYFLKNGFIQTDLLSVRSFKVYADGALGSRGACLLHPYHDRPKETGFMLSKPAHLDSIVGLIHAKGFQVNTHCIGDSANRTLLDIYGKYLGKEGKSKRWRIEHAQVVAIPDREKFKNYGIIPSVQPTHATSDMYWAGERLGAERLPTAYAYKSLLNIAGVLPLGSDFPIEDINPLYGFHAAVARQDAKGYPEGGFQPEDALSREEALIGMTRWAAYAQFEEKIKGSIEPGKWADFVVTEKDIMTIPVQEIRDTKVMMTFSSGKKVFTGN